MGFLTDILLDTIEDVAKTLPILFLAYLFLEWMENQTDHRFEKFLERHRRLAPLSGSLFGLFPSCGFSSAASSLYTTGVISSGTLIAVYLSCSDEMLAIALSAKASASTILPILIVKLLVAVTAGYIIDIFSSHRQINVNEFCEREHDEHDHGILYSALTHTIQVGGWLFVITFLFNGLVEWIGMDTLRAFVASYPNKSVLVCSLVGLIPSCASSVLLTTMYMEGVISFAAVCAGLLVNAGTGMMVLFRVNPRIRNNFEILFLTWFCGFISGYLIELLFTA